MLAVLPDFPKENIGLECGLHDNAILQGNEK